MIRQNWRPPGEGEVELADIQLTDGSRQAGEASTTGGAGASWGPGGSPDPYRGGERPDNGLMYGGAHGDTYDATPNENADGLRLLGADFSQTYKAPSGGGPLERLSNRIAARWKIVILAWLAMAFVGIIIAVPVSLTLTTLPSDPRARPLAYELRLSLPAGAFVAPNISANGVVQPPPASTASSAPLGSFDASASLLLNMTTDTSCLVLQAAALNISRVNVSVVSNPDPGSGSGATSGGSGGLGRRRLAQSASASASWCLCGCDAVLSCASSVLQASSESIVLDLGSRVLAAGSQVRLSLSYSGPIRSTAEGYGLFVSDPWVGDTPANGSALPADVLLTTQLEGRGARHLLPSLDEPSYKATFKVSVELPAGLTALSNTPGTAAPAATDGRTVYSFLATPPMSSYLLAVAAGKMSSIGMVVQTNYYLSYTQVALPLAKLDMLVVPGKTYGMENWGLIMYDVGRFMCPAAGAGTSAWDVFQAVDVICHEMAHQWFGNLVTCKDFDNIALNEGVASYVEYDCISAVLPYVLAGGAAAAAPLPSYPPPLPLAPLLRRFVLPPIGQPHGSHEGPISLSRWIDEDPSIGAVLGATASRAAAVSNVVAYAKAATALAAAAGLVGEAGVRAALRNLLTPSYVYGTATLADLVGLVADQAAGPLNASSPADAAALGGRDAVFAGMMGWLTTPGVPLLTASDATPAPPPPPSPLPPAPPSPPAPPVPGFNDTANPPTLLCPGALATPANASTSADPTANATGATDASAWWLPVAVSAAGRTSSGGGDALFVLNSPAGQQTQVSLSVPQPADTWVLRRRGFTQMYLSAYDGPVASGASGTPHIASLLSAVKAGFGLPPPAAAAPPAPEASDPALADRLAAVADAQSVLQDEMMRLLSPFTPPADTLLPAGAVPGAAAPGNAAPVPAVLALMDTALTSPLAFTGAGLHSLLPLLMGLEYLQGILATAAADAATASCNADLGNWVLRRLKPLAAAAMASATGAANASAIAAGECPHCASATDRFALRLATWAIVTEAALWGDADARAFACRQAANLTAADPDLLPAALAVPLAAPGGCGADGPDPDTAFNATLAAFAAAADPDTLSTRLFALAYGRGLAGPRTRLLGLLRSGVLASQGNYSFDSAAQYYVRPVPSNVATVVLSRMVASAQRELFFAVRDAAAASNGTGAGPLVGTAPNLPPGNDVLSVVMLNAKNFPFATLISGQGSRALSMLENAVGRALTTRDQLATVAALLNDEAFTGPASAHSPGALDSARSRILGRAQSRLSWLAANKGPICAFLKAESDALVAAAAAAAATGGGSGSSGR
ncbi:hypothetical protein GPECTOR_58g580 [Gonium pectorale]|uniref:Uncharacterized protein n=1 Tax=Gonium pectorale TaxID=33097 RepID=A0A150G5M5_GONPE|nr:hypothetical protein GPECTOR_58g580 [Gonium pectorale]|eukprot:KXZ45131.1 hypothetical protein GPECTOR_58g580 [Gonium pectorale]